MFWNLKINAGSQGVTLILLDTSGHLVKLFYASKVHETDDIDYFDKIKKNIAFL